MARPRKQEAKTERINLCLRQSERAKLDILAEREDRDLGYLCSWLVEWGLVQYETLGLSLVELKEARVVRDKVLRKRSEERLNLRQEAHRRHEELSGGSPERKRA